MAAEARNETKKVSPIGSSPRALARSSFSTVDALPPLPETASHILSTMGDEMVSIEDIVRVIERDPPVTARLLGLANSAFYGQRNHVTRVSDAIGRVLGLDLTRGLVMGISLGRSFTPSTCPGFDISRYWRYALYCATANTYLIEKIPGASLTECQLAFTAGLLANFGLLAMAMTIPDKTSGVLQHAADQPLHTRLKRTIGFDHRDAGRAIAELWSLPEPLIKTIGANHHQIYRGDWQTLVWTTKISQAAVSALLADVDCDEYAFELATQVALEPALQDLLDGAAVNADGVETLVQAVAA
ncbi:MAG: HDOD domain-containing protein [Pseudomonadota bacterium]